MLRNNCKYTNENHRGSTRRNRTMAAVARALGRVAIVEDHGLHEEAEADRAAADPTTHQQSNATLVQPRLVRTQLITKAPLDRQRTTPPLDSERTANTKRVGPKRREPNSKQRQPSRKR